MQYYIVHCTFITKNEYPTLMFNSIVRVLDIVDRRPGRKAWKKIIQIDLLHVEMTMQANCI